MPAALAVIVGGRGRGSNMEAISLACKSGQIPADVQLVILPSLSCPAAQTARDLDLPCIVVEPTSTSHEADLLKALAEFEIDFICLAGFLRLLPCSVLTAFPNRILNIHPALLPKFGGQGMYGMRVHEAVLAAGETESGCTIHLVNERYDEGAIVFQEKCPVLVNDTRESLASRVLSLEHNCYPRAIAQYIAFYGS